MSLSSGRMSNPCATTRTAPAPAPGHADALPVGHPCGNGYLEAGGLACAGQGDATAAAAVGLLNGQLQLGLLIGTRDRTGRAPGTEQAAQQVVYIYSSGAESP